MTRSRPARLAASRAESAARNRPRPSVSSTRLATPAEIVSGTNRPSASSVGRGRDGGPDPLRGEHRAVAIGGRGDDDELLAAVADDDVAVADGAPDRRATRSQDRVADRVAVVVVDRGEPVEIEDDEAQVGARASGVGVGRLDRLVEEASVEQPGQRIAHRRLRDPRVEVGVLERDRDLGGRAGRRCGARAPCSRVPRLDG